MNEARTPAIRFTALPATAAHEIVCASRGALAAVYDEISETPWVETCSVDLPKLTLLVRMGCAGLKAASFDPTQRWLERVERIARGL